MAVNPPGGGPLPYPADNQALWDQLKPRPTTALHVKNVHTTQVLVDGAGTLQGFAFRETGAAAGTIDFYDGRDSTGELLASYVIGASGGLNQTTNAEGIMFEIGLTIVVATSTIQGGIWVST